MFSIEFTLTQLDAAAPLSDIGILSIQGGADVITVPAGTNNLQISDGVNTSVIANVLTHLVPSTVRVVFTDNTMQVGVDGVAVSREYYDGNIGAGNIELVRDGGFAVKDISIYDEALAKPWVGVAPEGVALAEQSQLGYPGLGRVAYPTAYFPDVEPDQFTLPADVTEASLEQLVEFNFPVAGTAAGAQVPYVATNCQISTDNINFFDNLNAVLGQTVYGRAYAALGYQAATTYTVTSGSITDSFTITTAAGVATPLAESSRLGYPALGLLAYPTAPSPYFPNLDLGWDFIEVLGAGSGEGYIEVTPALADGDLIAFSNPDQVVIMQDAQVGVFDPLLETFEYKILKGGTVSGPFTYTVNVEEPDTTIPVITVVGGTTAMLQGGTYTPPTVEATDNLDGDITSDIVVTGSIDANTLGSQTVTYNVIDSAGNAALTVSHTVIVSAAVDSILPVITVFGGVSTMYIGGNYIPPTVTATDNLDGDITGNIQITGAVDTGTAGTYTIYYDVQDAAGNSAVQESHTVTVLAAVEINPSSIKTPVVSPSVAVMASVR